LLLEALQIILKSIMATKKGGIAKHRDEHSPLPTLVASTTAILLTAWVVVEFIRAVTIAASRPRTSSIALVDSGKPRGTDLGPWAVFEASKKRSHQPEPAFS
jgi:hypothetical protein